jgi:hypothetical protein
MPHYTQLRADDPGRVGRYSVAGRIEGIPSDDPIYLGTGPDGTDVSISMLAGTWAQDAAARDRFAAEAAVAMRVPPFCAARLLDSGIDGDVAYLVSEYVPGRSLLEVVSTAGVLSGPDLEAVAIGMATGLAAVHQAGLVHGHFGPEYVILPADGPLRVVEFGITPPYGTATPAADMFDWAQTVIYAASGQPPAEVPDLSMLPEPVRGAVGRCLYRDPLERPAARAVVLALLGDTIPSAGVLAEGSRRAARQDSGRAGNGAAADPRGAAPRPTAANVGPGPRSGPRPTNDRRHPADRRGQAVPAGAGFRSTAGPPGPRQRTAAGRPGGTGARQAMDQLPAVQSRGRAGRRPGTQDAPGSSARSPHSGTHQQRASRGRRVWLAAGAVLVVAVIGGATLLHLTQDGNSATGTNSRQTRGPGSSSPTTQTSSPGVNTPAAFAGSWHGLLQQLPDDTFHATIFLSAGATGGSVSYSGSGFSCTGTLLVTSATSKTLGMSQHFPKGSACGDGAVTVTLLPSGKLSFTFRGSPSATGKLAKG